MLDVGILLRNHIHMSLKDDTPAVFVARGGGNAHYHIAGFIGEGLHVVLFRPGEKMLAHHFLVLGRTRTTGQSVEVVPYY